MKIILQLKGGNQLKQMINSENSDLKGSVQNDVEPKMSAKLCIFYKIFQKKSIMLHILCKVKLDPLYLFSSFIKQINDFFCL